MFKTTVIDKRREGCYCAREIYIRDGKTLNINQLHELELILEQQNTNDRLEEGCYKVYGTRATIEFIIDPYGDIIY